MKKQKYPRTMNLPNSGSDSSDDVWWKNFEAFEGKQVVITEKLDGENTTVYPDGSIHARSLDSRHHPSRSWMKSFASEIGYKIPNNWRLCGENVFAFHSIFYTHLPSYFLLFGIYDDDGFCLSWDDVENFSDLLKIKTVPVIYKGLWDKKKILSLWNGVGAFPTYETNVDDPEFPKDFSSCIAEGYVVRLAESFHYDDFHKSLAKYVRPNHVQTSSHWMSKKVVSNILLEDH